VNDKETVTEQGAIPQGNARTYTIPDWGKAPSDITGLAARYAEIYDLRKNLEAEVEKLKAKEKELEPLLLDQFAETATTSLRLKTGALLSLKTQIWASIPDEHKPRIAEVFKNPEVNLGDLVQVTVNTQTLSSWVREQDRVEPALLGQVDAPKTEYKEHDIRDTFKLPEPLKEIIKITEKFSISVRRGKGS
jgi:hypothetical protein